MDTHPTATAISLDAIKAGDKREISRMVEAYSGLVYRLALRMLGNEQDAEDVLQETFIKALRAIQGFNQRSALSTWLYRIALNEIFMIMRRSKREVINLDEVNDDSEIAAPVTVVDWCCLPEDEFLTAEAGRVMDDAIQKLTPSLRSVFILRELNGASVKETAETLQISEAAVKTRLLRARLQLREELSSYYGEKVR